ncbi:hypothetical protein HMSSN036_73060 [Paenibacillus macerans]|nr:hypothetical protein HMSSN036_73060 [Paenibacillus macerans]
MALSGIMIVIISSAERAKVDFIAKWIAGNIWGTDWPFIGALLPWLILLVPFTLFKSRQLNLLSLSETSAIGVGVHLERERLILILAAVAASASAVSVTGGIAFIGLMAPHIAKALVGPRNQLFIPVAVLLGGWLLLIADTIAAIWSIPTGFRPVLWPRCSGCLILLIYCLKIASAYQYIGISLPSNRRLAAGCWYDELNDEPSAIKLAAF